ncbi:C40 family peptidase [Paenibacillus sp. SYP-B3998]|uniref:C40 family peptidase n=1 Tax=Paenibacillus sp. SYP-B3998 TaxID=2678564 RepID=A0A6G3ZYL6_9BACL|nr:C40 family peptidase [Paenibacillus sp. SYP-B3998]NEW06671.1 C40 family peptidase [Paenibacillus sp. SYP-B3998]
MKKNRLRKSLIGMTLCFSILASGSLIATPQSAHAANSAADIKVLTANRIISLGEDFIGVRYKYGSKTGLTDSFDCSSFTQYIFEQNGITLPRSSKEQSQVGTYVSKDQLQPGDLVFFYSPIHHVGMYIGDGKIIHTYGSPGVTISDIDSGWWSTHYQSARRVLN